MNPLLQRVLTVLAGAGIIVAGVLIPAAAPYLIPAGSGVILWAMPHPADKAS